MSRRLYPSEIQKIRALFGDGFTDFEISRILHIAKSTVTDFRNESQNNTTETNVKQPQENEIEQDNETTIENDGYPQKKPYRYTEVVKCPKCDTPKSEWITIEQALKQEYEIKEGYERFYDYICPKCRTLIPEKRLQVRGTCPECSSTSIDWIPVEKAKVSEEIKRVSDFICLNCWNPIKINNLD